MSLSYYSQWSIIAGPSCPKSSKMTFLPLFIKTYTGGSIFILREMVINTMLHNRLKLAWHPFLSDLVHTILEFPKLFGWWHRFRTDPIGHLESLANSSHYERLACGAVCAVGGQLFLINQHFFYSTN